MSRQYLGDQEAFFYGFLHQLVGGRIRKHKDGPAALDGNAHRITQLLNHHTYQQPAAGKQP